MTDQNAIDEVSRAKARYCRFVDTKQWDAFEKLFVAQPKIRMFDPSGAQIFAFDDRDAFVRISRQFLEKAQSIHQLHNAEIEQVAPGRVAAIWSMEDLILFPDREAGGMRRMNGYGHYHEIWEAGPDGWRIAELELRRTILEKTQA